MEYEIGTAFLLISLFFPRFVLFFWWITNNLPFNTTPLWGDVLLSIFLPRVLICWWIHDIQGMSGWFWIHLVAAILSFSYHILNYSKNKEEAEQKWKNFVSKLN